MEKHAKKDSPGKNERSCWKKLKKGGICFHRESANICTLRNEFFMNRVILLWNELPQKVRESVTLNSLKAGFGKMKLFLT